MKTAAVLHVLMVHSSHSVISRAEKYHKCRLRGPARSISIRGAFCCFLPHYMRDFAKHPKTKNYKAETGSIFGRAKNKNPNFEMCLTKTHKNHFEPGRINGVFLRGHIDPSYIPVCSN